MTSRTVAIVLVGASLLTLRAAGILDRDHVGKAATKRTLGDRSGTGKVDGRIRVQYLLRSRVEPPAHPEYERTGQRRTGAPQQAVPESTPDNPPIGEGGPVPRARKSPGPAFSIFRNTIAGTTSASAAEPSVANDRDGVLYTANWFAKTSGNSGLSYTALSTNTNPIYGGFCCDQVAYAVDRGSYSLVLWLQQYTYSASANENALRLHLFRGKDDLVSGVDSCTAWDFEPQQDFKLGQHLWFDFNQFSHTSKFLYITTNVRDATGTESNAGNSPRIGGMIFRISLDDLDDGNCQISFHYWYKDGDPYISPVQNAASTMYLATHVPGAFEGKNLRIYSVADSSVSMSRKDKDIKNFKDRTGLCILPDAFNPCGDNHDGRMSGFRSGSTIGWLWMGDDENSFPFPYVRVAVFETGSLDKVLEHQIWSDDFAWQNPTVGVSAEGHLGVVLYAMGGGRFPKAQGFILTNPRDWDGIEMHSISSGVKALTGGEGSWGHYGAVRQYGNCTNTFLATAYTTNSAGTEDARLVWFGDPADACIDLATTAVSRTDGNRQIEHPSTIDVDTTVKNTGSKASPASFLGYYFSRDRDLDDDDISFDTTRAVGALNPGASTTLHATLPVPAVVLTTDMYVIACADDLEQIAEITQTNNCLATSRTWTVKSSAHAEEADLALSQVITHPPALRARKAFTVTETVRAGAGKITAKARPNVAYSLLSTPGLGGDEAALTVRTVGTPKIAKDGRSQVAVRKLTLSARIPPGTWYLRGCLTHARHRGDQRASNDCRVVRKPLTIGGRTDTRGPAKRRGADG